MTKEKRTSLREGTLKKGNINTPPSSPRPSGAPQGQGTSSQSKGGQGNSNGGKSKN